MIPTYELSRKPKMSQKVLLNPNKTPVRIGNTVLKNQVFNLVIDLKVFVLIPLSHVLPVALC